MPMKIPMIINTNISTSILFYNMPKIKVRPIENNFFFPLTVFPHYQWANSKFCPNKACIKIKFKCYLSQLSTDNIKSSKMIRHSCRALFSKTKDSHTFRQKWNYIKQMKPYILPFLHPNKVVTKSLLKSYGLLVLSKMCFFGGPFFIKLGINSLNGTAAFFNPILYFLGFGLAYTGSVYFQQKRNLQTLNIINIALLETTSKAYKHMLSLGPQFYFKGPQRHILFNLYKAQGAFEQNLKTFTQYFFPILLDISLSISVLLYYSNSIFALSFLTCYSAYAIFTIKYSQKRRLGIKEFRQAEKRIDFVTSETFSNYFNVKYFQKEEEQLKKYQNAIQVYYDKNYVVQHSLGVLNTVQRLIFGTGLTFNMMLAAYYTQIGLLTTGDIMMIQTLMLQFLGPLFILGSMYRSFQDNLIDIKKISSMMLTPSSVVEGSEALPEVHGEITFKNVSFRYINDSNHILNQLSFTVKPNKFVAIIGKSGIGKTTILNLIFRLYDPREGVVELDGKDLKSLNFNFRKHITFVSQHPYLFNGTVMENLKFGNPSCTDEEVIELTKKLHLHEIIENLPGKYKENVGQKGSIFSGGEKQRISLIRALIKKTKIILLDEPTSSVDKQTEQIIGKILSELHQTTKILITHREGILHYCDDVIRVG